MGGLLNISMKGLFVVVIVNLFLQSCKVDPDITPPCSEPGGWGHATIITPLDKPYRNAPTSNPLNVNEFAYLANDDSIEGIWKYNLATNEKQLIIEFDIWETPDWSIKDWIVFGSSRNIYICKSNGDSLRQLTFENGNYDPSWSPDGNFIIFERDENDAIQNYAVINLDGNTEVEYKSIKYAGKAPCWSPDGSKIAFISTNNNYNKSVIAYFELSDPEVIHYLPSSAVNKYSELLGPLDWYPETKTIIYNDNDDIYSINIETNEITLIKTGTGCIRYNYHTILYDGKTLISTKKESSYDSETNTDYHDYDLVKILSDGTEIIISY